MFAAFHRILVAIDGSQGGLDAAALAGRLRGDEAEIAIARVVDRDGDQRTEDERVREARRVLATGTATPVVFAHDASVAAGLRALVNAHGADLLVVGARHHRRSRDHTRAVLRELPCAVAVATWGYADQPHSVIRSVGVGFVDDRPGRAVLDTARDLAWQLGAEVHATTVVAASNWESADSGIGRKAVVAGRRMAEIPGVHGAAVEGRPHRALTTLTNEVDLLVIGSGRHGAIRRLLLHNVAEHLSHASRCPLIVVPGSDGADRRLS